MKEELRVNAVSNAIRTIQEVKHKWQDLQLKAKKKETQRKNRQSGTGGGPAPKNLTVLEEKVIAIIPKICTQGIDGGIDTIIEVQSVVDVNVRAEFSDQPDKENGILINMATGQEIVLEADSSSIVPSMQVSSPVPAMPVSSPVPAMPVSV